MLHQMAQGSVSSDQSFIPVQLPRLIFLTAIATSIGSFAAAKDEKKPAAAPVAKPADDKAEKPPA